MRKLLRLLLFCSPILLSSHFSNAQTTYGNEWIKYNQPYYKFKIVTDQEIYKIPYSTLNAAGLGSIYGSQYQLYKNGKEIPLYVTTTGIFGSNDYIEFFGTRNDGKVDSGLYMKG